MNVTEVEVVVEAQKDIEEIDIDMKEMKGDMKEEKIDIEEIIIIEIMRKEDIIIEIMMIEEMKKEKMKKEMIQMNHLKITVHTQIIQKLNPLSAIFQKLFLGKKENLQVVLF